jgi:hypothetical protein
MVHTSMHERHEHISAGSQECLRHAWHMYALRRCWMLNPTAARPLPNPTGTLWCNLCRAYGLGTGLIVHFLLIIC